MVACGMRYEEKDIQAVVQKIVQSLGKQKTNTLALHGDLGAGKTTFVSALARELGVSESIISPTFVVYRVYEIPPLRAAESTNSFTKLVHIDAYRLTGEVDAQNIRLHELFADPANLVCIEWPEHIGDTVPADALHVYLTYTGEHERDIEIK
jgi:tRNA threonylcarbamoyladenosine biosynthesis protein TsaE